MLCATNQVNAQDATSSPSSTATASTPSSHIMLMHDPYDPRINDEYEALVRKWTDHLLSKSRHSPIDSAISSAATPTTTPSSPSHHSTNKDKTIDRLLEEQWIDAQRVLSCAQAWNTRDSLSIQEAVRTMNILGLRMMQRSLTTRHELNTQNQHQSAKTSDLNKDMPSFDLQSKTLLDEAITIPRFSLALSLDEDDEHEMHAPLLRRYQQSSDASSSSDSISHQHHPTTSSNNVQPINNPCSTTSTLSTPARRPFRLMQSPSAPNFSESALLMERENCVNSYYRYYPTSWRPLPEHGNDDEENNRHISISSSSTSSNSTSSSSSQDHEGYTWKSWFNNSHHQSNQHKQHVCTFCWHPISKKSFSTGDADDVAAARLLSSSNSSSFESTAGVGASGQAQIWSPDSYHSACSPLDPIHSSSNDELSSMEEDVFETPTTSSFGFQTDTILRSESSISAFRPISKNLAPRCSPPAPPAPTDNWRYRRRETSSSMQQADSQQRRPAIPKSQSFPSKVASLASSSSNKIPDVPIIKASTTKSSASATTVPTTIMGRSVDKGSSSSSSKERNFVMRSIVSKKASLSKLFSGSKK